jgi:hypothetical protein
MSDEDDEPVDSRRRVRRPPAGDVAREAALTAERAVISDTLQAGALESPQGCGPAWRELQDPAQQD